MEIDELKRVPISDSLDSKWTFFILHNIHPLGELEVAFIIEVNPKRSIPENAPPMFDILRWMKYIVGSLPINGSWVGGLKG